MISGSDLLKACVKTGERKANLSGPQQFLLGTLAGTFIAFGAQVSNMASHTFESANIAKLIGGLIFPTGLILVLVAGAELFTGNCLMITGLVEKKFSLARLLRSWILVYLGNLVGSLIIALLISWSGQLNMNSGLLGAFTIRTASSKVSLSFCNAFVLGILCNWLVCLAVWMSFAAEDIICKVFAAFFPVWTFVTSGFEHSIANMYYIPAGILAKSNSLYVEASGLSEAALENLNWHSMFINNLLPVTLGNILGGALFVGLVYWFIYHKEVNS